MAKYEITIKKTIVIDTEDFNIKTEQDAIALVLGFHEEGDLILEASDMKAKRLDPRVGRNCYIELDTVKPNDGDFCDWCDDHDIKICAWLWSDGPNDWPEIRYEGTYEALVEMLKVHWVDCDLAEFIHER